MTELADSLPINRARSAALRLLTDTRLARLAATGDRDAFAAIYERYHQPLYRYCRSIVRHPDDALDALQSTMLNAMRAMENREGGIALKPWLYRIAHNESISLIRSRPQADELHAKDASIGDGAEEDAEGRARLRELVSDIRELPERQRGALVMRELGGLDYTEVAAALAVSTDAAKQSVLEARRALVDIGRGRDMDCDNVCRIISDGDRRTLRGRGLRAHLRACASCREFETAIRIRRADLAAFSPVLPAATAATVLHSLIGGGGGGGGGGLLAGLLGGGSVGSTVGKSLALGAVTVATGAGALGLSGPNGPLSPGGGEAEAAETDRRSDAQGERAEAEGTARATEARRNRAHARARNRRRARAQERRAHGRAQRSDARAGDPRGDEADNLEDREDQEARDGSGERDGDDREERDERDERDREDHSGPQDERDEHGGQDEQHESEQEDRSESIDADSESREGSGDEQQD